MVAYVKGTLEETEADHIVVETAGTGYQILVPASVFSELPSHGEEIKVYTYLHVREDAMVLYGFLTKEDRHTFKLLITVNGIGPKGAIGILSGISTYELKVAVMSNDVNKICQAPGIGKKTAQKLILELKDKLKIDDYTAMVGQEVGSGDIAGASGKVEEAVQALISLGYSNNEAYRAVKGLEQMESVEQILKEALKKLALI